MTRAAEPVAVRRAQQRATRPRPPQACLPGERRQQLRTAHLNGIESVRVDADARTLRLRLLTKLAENPEAANVRIDATEASGRRVRALDVRVRRQRSPRLPDELDVVLDRLGDRGGYTVRLVSTSGDGTPTAEPLSGFDPRYAAADFSFIAECPDISECPAGPPCDCCPDGCGSGTCATGDAASLTGTPVVDYLAKDYASFRRLLLDRLALVAPQWVDRQVPDLMVTLVELLAYAGDRLSYRQDAIATEAYLGTARLRTSIRRHLRLVGYRMHDGCNARAWVHLGVARNATLPAGQFRFVTRLPELADRAAVGIEQLRHVDQQRYQVFEPLLDRDVPVRAAHNRIRLWTWGSEQCRLPVGTTCAVLVDGPPQPRGGDDQGSGDAAAQGDKTGRARRQAKSTRELDLRTGDVLVLEEVRGPRTGVPGDADPRHRQAIRLTKVHRAHDAVYGQPLLEVCWDDADALRFEAVLSAVGGPQCCLLEDVTVARGNVVLVDHGRTEPWCDESPPAVTAGQPTLEPMCCVGLGRPGAAATRPLRFTPVLAPAPLTRSAPFPDPTDVAAAQAGRLDALVEVPRRHHHESQNQRGELDRLDRLSRRALSGRTIEAALAPDGLEPGGGLTTGPASSALTQDPRHALPALWLESGGETWSARADLIDSGPDDPHLVAEADDEGASRLRFGDGQFGRAVEPGQEFDVRLRVGNGAAGNVAAEAIGHVVFCHRVEIALTAVRNPLPASGGTDPEPSALARQLGPTQGRYDPLRRAVVADDYSTVAEGVPGVQDAATDLAWTGAGYEADVAVDPLRRTDVPATLRRRVDARLRDVRRIGHDLRVREPDRVPVDLTLQICLAKGADRHRVLGQLRALLGDAVGPDGTLGAFHPDRLRFGTDLYASQLVSLAVCVPGVRSATVQRLARARTPGPVTPAGGRLAVAPLELATGGGEPGSAGGSLTIVIVNESSRAVSGG